MVEKQFIKNVIFFFQTRKYSVENACSNFKELSHTQSLGISQLLCSMVLLCEKLIVDIALRLVQRVSLKFGGFENALRVKVNLTSTTSAHPSRSSLDVVHNPHAIPKSLATMEIPSQCPIPKALPHWP